MIVTIPGHMQGVTVAADCLVRYVRRHRGEAGPLNTLGVLLERENLLRTSMDVLSAAKLLAETQEQQRTVLQVWSLSSFKMNCQVLRKSRTKSHPFPCS